MLNIAKQSSSLAIVDHELRCLNAVQQAQKIVQDSAKFGQIQFLDCSFYGPLSTYKEWNWWRDASQGGGILGAIGKANINSSKIFNYVDEPSLILRILIVLCR